MNFIPVVFTEWLMISEILCRGSYPASPGSGAAKLLLQCRNCRMAWNLFLDIIWPKLGVSNDHTREFSSQYDSNVGFLIMPMLKTIPRNASISSRVTGIQFRSREWLPKMRGGLLFMAICCCAYRFVSVTWMSLMISFSFVFKNLTKSP